MFRKRLRNVWCGIVALMICWGPVSGFAFGEYVDIEVIIDGELLDTGGMTLIKDGRVIVPMRGVFEALGANIDWQPDTRTVRAVKGGRVVQLTIGESTALVNGSPIELSVPGQIVKGRTLVPLRFVSESIGAYVHWNGKERVVSISSDGTPQVYPSHFVHINSADVDTLTRIIHISRARAEQIIRLREEKKFESYEDLLRIRGIGEVRLQQIREQGLIRF